MFGCQAGLCGPGEIPSRTMTSPLPVVQPGPAPLVDPAARGALERRARLLAWAGAAWHVAEFAVAVAAGVAASSIALIGFGIDSLIEALAGAVVVWLFTGRRRHSRAAERRAQQLIAASFAALGVYIAVEAVRTLAGAHHPDPSW